MKRVLLIIFLSIALLAAAAYWFVPHYALNMITQYVPYTFASVLDYDSMRADYGIGRHSNPTDYGFTEVEELAFLSVKDSLRLSAWYIGGRTPSDQCIVLVHGRTSNRLKPMKYLALFDSLGLDSTYNFFLPDLRNSGQSDAADTYMGYKFAEDLAGGLLRVHQQYGQRHFVLYGFSMGAITITTLLHRQDLQQLLQDSDISVDAILLDSPLSNVKEVLKYEAQKMYMPGPIFERTFALLNEETDGYAEHMNLSTQLQHIDIPVLILQSMNDDTTPAPILQQELKKLSPDAIRVHYFSGPDHVKLYQSPATQTRYTEAIEAFFQHVYQKQTSPTPVSVQDTL
jgi:pimeloyl-ACP methyl ester carboxylesterase